MSVGRVLDVLLGIVSWCGVTALLLIVVRMVRHPEGPDLLTGILISSALAVGFGLFAMCLCALAWCAWRREILWAWWAARAWVAFVLLPLVLPRVRRRRRA
jgi:hypothetical protein